MQVKLSKMERVKFHTAGVSVATAIAGVFANFANKTGKITEKLEDVDKAKSRGVSCQH